MGIFRLREGQIVEEWQVADSSSLLKQLGFMITAPEAVPVPG